MKKICAIFLLFSLCFNGTGYYIIHKQLQKQIRKEIKARIKQQVPQDELVSIMHSPENAADFNWIHSREFRYKGTMYDIVSVKRVSETIIIYNCVTDHQETLLFKNLGQFVNNTMNANPANSRANNLLINFFSSLYPPITDNRLLILDSEEINWIIQTSGYQPPYLQVLPLPPKA